MTSTAGYDSVEDAIYSIPSFVAGSGQTIPPISNEHATSFALRIATVIMSNLRQAYIVKAQHGTDEAGLKWPELSPRTIAARLARVKSTRKFHEDVVAANRRFRLARQRLQDVPGDAARRLEHTRAANELVRASKKLREAGENMEILRDTGRLFNSLSPGVKGDLMSDGILEVSPGQATFGTNVEYAERHHLGDPSTHLPQRRLWAEPQAWPDIWWKDIGEAVATGIAEIVRVVLESEAQ